MKKYYFLFLVTIIPFFSVFSQKANISGSVSDYKTKETLVGVSVIISPTKGVITNEKGFYSIELEAGEYNIEYKFIGYVTEKKKINLKENDQITINVRLEDESKILNEVVVSAGKFEQKLSEVTVSMDVIKASMIENTNTQTIETAIQQVPGVMVMEEQVSIRGGSSYSYGAGSRVLLLVDDLPMLAGASGDVKWCMAPIENIEQVEIIKGASSALYGSSALNGVINIRTRFPKTKPETKLIFSSGIYGNPEREAIKWWGNTQPIFTGIQFFHSRMIDNFDLVVAANLQLDNGYRELNDCQQGRVNFNTRWRNKKVKGLFYGVNFDGVQNAGHDYFLWKDGDSGVYRANIASDQQYHNTRLYIDPYITYFSTTGNRHSLKTRLYRTVNANNTNKSSEDNTYFGEYQYQKYLENNLTWTSGITSTFVQSIADTYGKRYRHEISGAVYSQFDKKLDRFTASLGARWEAYRLENDQASSRPVFRTGVNYRLFDYTHFRASFGQGFRYPTICEKYIRSSAGSINLFPNDSLKPEKGWSAEVGFKQGFKISNWTGYLDVAGFWTEYRNMIEFGFGYHFPYVAAFYPPDTVFKYLGFKAYNVSNAQITGVDIAIGGQGKLFGLPTSLMAGYTYTNPIDLNYKDNGSGLTTSNSRILKYRFYHSAKVDFEMSYKEINYGFSVNYFSYIINIDKVFQDSLRFPNGKPIIFNGKPMFILPGLKEYREKNNTGTIVIDGRVGFDLSEKSRFSFVVRNMLNKEYMIRPGDVQAPRTFALQYILKV